MGRHRGFQWQLYDEVLGPWKPFPDIIHDSLRKTLERFNLPYRKADSQALVDAVPTCRAPTSRCLKRGGRWRRATRW